MAKKKESHTSNSWVDDVIQRKKDSFKNLTIQINRGCGRILLWDHVYVFNIYSDDEDDIVINVMEQCGISSVRISFSKEDMENPFIYSLFVVKEFRQKGCARDIMRFVGFICKMYCEIHLHKLKSLSLIVDNLDWKYEWYKRIGYKDDFHDSALYMKKEIEYMTLLRI